MRPVQRTELPSRHHQHQHPHGGVGGGGGDGPTCTCAPLVHVQGQYVQMSAITLHGSMLTTVHHFLPPMMHLISRQVFRVQNSRKWVTLPAASGKGWRIFY